MADDHRSMLAGRHAGVNAARIGLLLALILLITSCKKDPNLAFIQGLWYHKNAHLANIPGESAQVTTWEFDNGYFSISSCCFVESYYSGYYSVSERAENKLILDLYNMRGQVGDNVLARNETMSITIKIDTEADTITIGGEGPYTRLSP